MKIFYFIPKLNKITLCEIGERNLSSVISESPDKKFWKKIIIKLCFRMFLNGCSYLAKIKHIRLN